MSVKLHRAPREAKAASMPPHSKIGLPFLPWMAPGESGMLSDKRIRVPHR
jgi:hypothetical protein